MTQAEAQRLIGRRRLPAAFERWRLALEPGESRPTNAAQWAGAVVVIRQGVIEVSCEAGGQRTFRAGDMLALGWLPLRRLFNPGPEVVRLIAVRRRGRRPSEPFLHVRRRGA